MRGEPAPDRTVLRIAGADREQFLQGLVTNDVRRLEAGAVYAALLTPQGKYLADFLLVPASDAVLLDVKADLADGLLRRLSMYRLRTDVEVARVDLQVTRGLGIAPEGAFADPRHPDLGWRAYGPPNGSAAMTGPGIDWDAIRVAHVIPETGVELRPDESYILEAGFERLHGVDFRKGCYVGQEVTARMKHKTELKKGLARVRVSGEAFPGAEITTPEGKPAGILFTRAGDHAIAWLRHDRTDGSLHAGSALLALERPEA